MNKLECLQERGGLPLSPAWQGLGVTVSSHAPVPVSRQEPPVVFSSRHKDDERADGMLPLDLIKTLPSCYDKHN